MDRWIMEYGSLGTIITENVSKFMKTFFTALLVTLRIRKMTPTAYHRKKKGQTERYNKRIVSLLRIYAAIDVFIQYDINLEYRFW